MENGAVARRHGHEKTFCTLCLPRLYIGTNVIPSCRTCTKDFLRRIDTLQNRNEVLESRTKVLETELARQKREYEARVAFLMLEHRSSSDEALTGDASFVVQGSEQLIHSHQFILADKSPVFSKMFETQTLEEEIGVIRINDAAFPVMQAVIDFCYTAEIQFTDEIRPEEVLKVAHKYAIAYLNDLCAEELARTINKDNLAQMLSLSKKFEAKVLQQAAIKYFKENFNSVFMNIWNEFI